MGRNWSAKRSRAALNALSSPAQRQSAQHDNRKPTPPGVDAPASSNDAETESHPPLRPHPIKRTASLAKAGTKTKVQISCSQGGWPCGLARAHRPAQSSRLSFHGSRSGIAIHLPWWRWLRSPETVCGDLMTRAATKKRPETEGFFAAWRIPESIHDGCSCPDERTYFFHYSYG